MIKGIKDVKKASIVAGSTIAATGLISSVIVMSAAKKKRKQISKEAEEMVIKDKTLEVLERIDETLKSMKFETERKKEAKDKKDKN